jgi:hypothetical protein
MKLIYFLLILLIFYFIATRIQVIHESTLSPTEQYVARLQKSHPTDNICSEKSDVPASEIFNNQVSSVDSRNYMLNPYDTVVDKDLGLDLPDANGLILLVKNDYQDLQYRFNVPNQPVTFRYPDRNTVHKDSKYLRYIKKEILTWNNIFEKYYDTHKKFIKVLDMKPIVVEETESEFKIKLNVALSYRQKMLYLQLGYYGQIEKSDDFLNGGRDIYILQLYDVRQISKADFEPRLAAMNAGSVRAGEHAPWVSKPFMTMEEQMKYVNDINKMHREELKN